MTTGRGAFFLDARARTRQIQKEAKAHAHRDGQNPRHAGDGRAWIIYDDLGILVIQTYSVQNSITYHDFHGFNQIDSNCTFMNRGHDGPRNMTGLLGLYVYLAKLAVKS